MPYRVYILLCSDGSYYTCSAADVEKRVWQHQEGVSKETYTYTRRPIKLVGVQKKLKDIQMRYALKGKLKVGAAQRRKP